MTTLGKRLIQSAKEARVIARGEADPATYRVNVPSDIDVGAIRRRLSMTQSEFAGAFGFPAGTVRDWEQGRRQPDTAARAYLKVIERDPGIVQSTLAPPPVPSWTEVVAGMLLALAETLIAKNTPPSSRHTASSGPVPQNEDRPVRAAPAPSRTRSRHGERLEA